MKNLFLFSGLCAALFTAPSRAVDTDMFSGIYSVVNPETGAEVDVMKIRKYEDSYGVFSYLGGNEVQQGSISATEVTGPTRMLSLKQEGNLYYVPNGSKSPVGGSDTGYISDITGLSALPLKRRELPTKRERGVNGIHTYTPSKDDVAVSLRVLNYGTKPLQLGVSSPTNSKNATDTDPVNAYMASAFNCCFYLPSTWKDSLKLNIEFFSLEGKIKSMPLAIPKYDQPQNFEVAVNLDGTVEIFFQRSDQEKPLPRPPIVTN